MPWVPAAIGVVGAVAGAAISSDASRSAANTQADAARNASQVQQDMFQQNKADLQPWMQQGKVGLNDLSALMFNPDGTMNTGSAINKPFSMADFQQSPGYQFQLQQGMGAIENSAASKGLTGNTLKDLSTFGTGLANQDWYNAMNAYTTNQNNIFNRLNTISGTGANAAGGIANLGQSTAGQIGSNMIGAGNAQAAGRVGAAAGITGNLNNGLQNWLLARQQQQAPFDANNSAWSGWGGTTSDPWYG